MNFFQLQEKKKQREPIEKRIREEVDALSNDNLFSEFKSLSGGDDYDGCFTENGAYRYKLITIRVNKILMDAHIITAPLEVD